MAVILTTIFVVLFGFVVSLTTFAAICIKLLPIQKYVLFGGFCPFSFWILWWSLFSWGCHFDNLLICQFWHCCRGDCPSILMYRAFPCSRFSFFIVFLGKHCDVIIAYHVSLIARVLLWSHNIFHLYTDEGLWPQRLYIYCFKYTVLWTLSCLLYSLYGVLGK